MLVTLKGMDGPVIIETSNICWIGRAVDMKTMQPIMGHSTIMYPGGVGVPVFGAPPDVKERIERATAELPLMVGQRDQ